MAAERAVLILLVASISTLAYSSTTEATHSPGDPPPPVRIVWHKKKAGSGYLTSSALQPNHLQNLNAVTNFRNIQEGPETTCDEACRYRHIALNIGLAFVLLGVVNCCGYYCWMRGAKSKERSYDNVDDRPRSLSRSLHLSRSPREASGLSQARQNVDVPDWARPFQPWKLIQVAGTRVGQQAAVLMFLFWEVCSWNTHHHLVLMNCRRDVLGWWVYSCEGTKAFARCFPLFAASMAMIVTGRYILQFRIYYHFLLKNVLLDFTNHDIKKDLVLMLVLLCFLCAIMHFTLDFFFPPYVTLEKLTTVVTVYFLPCCVFFLLWREASDVEWHMMPLPKLVEDDPQWATEHLGKSRKYLDTSIKHNFKQAERNLYYQKPDHMFELDELLDEIIRISHPATSNFEEEPDHGETKHGIHGLWKALWPGQILLNPYLKDEDSKNFSRAFKLFVTVFIVVQFVLLFAFAVSAVQEARDAVPGGIPHDAFYAGGEAFEQLGYNGYCRDEGQHRPPGYFIAQDKLAGQVNGTDAVSGQHGGASVALLMRTAFTRLRSPAHKDADHAKQLCAYHCAGVEECIAFAMDPDLCNIYLSKEVPTPSGWDTLRSIHRTSAKDLSLSHGKKTDKATGSHTQWTIVTTDHSMGTTCFVKLEQQQEPENFVGCAVYLCHMLMVLFIIYASARKTFKGYFRTVSTENPHLQFLE